MSTPIFSFMCEARTKSKELIWLLRHIKHSLSIKRNLSNRKREILSWQRFWKSYHAYKRLSSVGKKQPWLECFYPCLGEDTSETKVEPIYFYQDTWAFEEIVKASPSCHVDVGSHHKLVAFLSKIFPVTMIDIRPLSLPMKTLKFQKGSILNLPFEDESVESLSSLCVVEHIGLGRYGDRLDPDGSEKAIAELCRVISPGGHLYVSVPIDDCNKLFFNAHRAFEEKYFEELLQPLKIIDKKYISGETFMDVKPDGFSIALYHVVRVSCTPGGSHGNG